MSTNHPTPQPGLAEMPLWRLLVLLNDIETEVGTETPDARIVSRMIARRLAGERAHPGQTGEVYARG